MNLELLRWKIYESGKTIKGVASDLGIKESSMYRKLAHDGRNITVNDARKIKEVLNLTVEDMNSIFFS